MKRLYSLAAAALLATAAGTALSTTPASAGPDPYLGEMMVVGFNFCPRGWAQAHGQLIAISSNQALFSLLGCTYGGDCRTTFGLPDMRGRSTVGVGSGPGLPVISWGQRGGQTEFTMTTSHMASHNHVANSTLNAVEETGNSAEPEDNFIAGSSAGADYLASGSAVSMHSGSVVTQVLNNGGQIPVTKRSPFLGQYWCIATQGVFPSRN